MRIPIQLLVQGEAEVSDLIQEGELGPINVKVFLYHKFVLPMKQDDPCFHRGEPEAIILTPLDCHINGGLGEVDQDIRVLSCYQEHPVISIAFRLNARNTLKTVQKTVKYNVPDQWREDSPLRCASG